MDESIDKFIAALADSIAAGTFVKLSLANYKGTDEQLQKITARPVETKKGSRILFQYRGQTSDQAKNFSPAEAADQVKRHLHTGFRSGHLFTTEKDLQIIIGKRSAKLTAGKPTFKSAEPRTHDREKHYIVDINAPYLKALGITTERQQKPDRKGGRAQKPDRKGGRAQKPDRKGGRAQKPDRKGGLDAQAGDPIIIRADQRDKWKQINKFVEILDQLYESSDLSTKLTFSIIDMGSGKGYLTFAAYDHFLRKRVKSDSQDFGLGTLDSGLTVLGIESRPHLVALCNEIAEACGYTGLKFIQGNIADSDTHDVDILIALHACDTATDDALYKGIAANASVIVAAPCCHQEVKKQLKSPDLLAGILKHPVMLERTAETVTDGLRSLLLEREGYRTKMFEFVPTEHTPKNNMLVAVRTGKSDPAKTTEIDSLVHAFGIEHQRLLDRLDKA